MSEARNFWSRRRAGVAEEVAAEEAGALAQEHAALEEMSDAELLATFDLPDPETMKMGDDFSVFMSKAIPDRLRRMALRKLWVSNPVLANVDSLVDYGEDYTDAAMVIENMQTTYQVGKGMLKHVQEMARQAEEAANPPEDVDEVDEVIEDEVLVADGDEADAVAPAFDIEIEAEDEGDAYAVATPRRMTFRTEEAA